MIRSLGSSRELDELRRSGSRATAGPLTMISSSVADASVTRVAYAIGKPVGTAVRRNRLRRRLRPLLAALDRAGRMPASAYLVICRPPAGDLDSSQLNDHLGVLLPGPVAT